MSSGHAAPRQARDVMAFGHETGRVLSDGRVIGRSEPFAKVFQSSRLVKQTVGLTAWGILEDIALDATLDAEGRLVAETSARRIAANLGINKETLPRTPQEPANPAPRRPLSSSRALVRYSPDRFLSNLLAHAADDLHADLEAPFLSDISSGELGWLALGTKRSDEMAPMPNASVLVDHPAEGVTRLRLNRPTRRNAVNFALLDALTAALQHIDSAAIVLDSADDTMFCAGADLSLSNSERARLSDGLYRLYEQMIRLPLPIVAALQGPAIGGGAQLAVAADLRVAHPDSWLRFPGPGHGLAVGAWALPSLVGRGRALEICLTMRRVKATEAAEMGLVDRLDEDPSSVAVALAADFARLDAQAAARLKRIVVEGAGLTAALEAERRGNRQAWDGSVAGLLDDPGQT